MTLVSLFPAGAPVESPLLSLAWLCAPASARARDGRPRQGRRSIGPLLLCRGLPMLRVAACAAPIRPAGNSAPACGPSSSVLEARAPLSSGPRRPFEGRLGAGPRRSPSRSAPSLCSSAPNFGEGGARRQRGELNLRATRQCNMSNEVGTGGGLRGGSTSPRPVRAVPGAWRPRHHQPDVAAVASSTLELPGSSTSLPLSRDSSSVGRKYEPIFGSAG
jgi:hypothetical protein